MRRKISLYIGEQPVDLDDQSFILFNYQMDDLTNPTIVKNSFSQQVTLKGTPVNNRIFGVSFRTDRRIANTGGDTGVDFDASRKTPFTIYNEMGEVLESGYVKLDNVIRKGADIQYRIRLYGGLGSLFYSLSYDDNGNRRTLADLDYLGTDNPDSELDFTIDKDAIGAAWARLGGDSTQAAMWDVINFAPAYNGIPDGNFAANKALVVPSSVGLQDSVPEGGVTYGLKSGYALVNLAEAQDEWAVKDLRSYLQRPVLSMRAFWDAVCNPDNNGGYEVDAAAVQDVLKMGAYADLWMTLPMISSIGGKQESGGLSLTMSSSATSGNEVAQYSITGSVPSGTKVTASINCNIRFTMSVTQYAQLYSTLSYAVDTRTTRTFFSVLFIQAVAYGSDNTVIGGSKIKVANGISRNFAAGAAEACGYNPAWPADYENLSVDSFPHVSGAVYRMPSDIGLTVEAQDVAYYKILVSAYQGTMLTTRTEHGGSTSATTYTGDGSTSTPEMYTSSTSYMSLSTYVVAGAAPDTVSYTTGDTLRSGASITKAMLLSSSHTPAEYMLSFCKIFGLYFVYDNAVRKVTVLRRNDLYEDVTTDLTRMVDLSMGVNIQPLVFQAKWYDFILEGAGGAFYDEYKEVEGIEYGLQRVNTGFDFNAEAVSLMDAVVFRNAATVLARSKYFNYIFTGQTFRPSPFLDKGNTYTLWSPSGDTLDTDISCPPTSATVTYYNTNVSYKGYDVDDAAKLELRDKDNKPLDGADILVFLDSWKSYPYFKITDDVPAMDALNEGVPCWLLEAGSSALTIPVFSRYVYSGDGVIGDSLDFGIPRQLDMPGVTITPGSTIYERGWRMYMADRYDVNTKVMTCRVNFSGMRVGHELLRRFWWYDNSLWVLNSIRNYSLTTYDPVECEFIQVQDKDNYLTGQTY